MAKDLMFVIRQELFFQITGFVLLLISLSSCGQSEIKNQYQVRDDQAPLVDSKYSLTTDRNEIEKMRKDVPVARQRENDEKAFMFELFADLKKSPNAIREKFDNFVRKKRDLFQKDQNREREKFTLEERKKRDYFLKSATKARSDFMSSKPSKETRDEFFKNQEDGRKEFFADERDRRQDFESDMRERRKSFEDYVREKQNEFNQELRIFRQKQDEQKKEKAAVLSPARTVESSREAVQLSEQQLLEQELGEARSKSGTQIQAGE